jgi:hypothetical protein
MNHGAEPQHFNYYLRDGLPALIAILAAVGSLWGVVSAKKNIGNGKILFIVLTIILIALLAIASVLTYGL